MSGYEIRETVCITPGQGAPPHPGYLGAGRAAYVSAAEAGEASYLRARVLVGFVDVISERRQLTLKFGALPLSLHITDTHDQTTYT